MGLEGGDLSSNTWVTLVCMSQLCFEAKITGSHTVSSFGGKGRIKSQNVNNVLRLGEGEPIYEALCDSKMTQLSYLFMKDCGCGPLN